MIDRPSENASFGAASGAELPRPSPTSFPARRARPAPFPGRTHPTCKNGDLPAMRPQSRAFGALREPDRRRPPDDVRISPAYIANGRYLPIFPRGWPPAVQALDTTLNRQVALTLHRGRPPCDILRRFVPYVCSAGSTSPVSPSA